MKEKWILFAKRYGKYIAAVVIFATVMLFFGEQSVLSYAKRAAEIHRLETQRDAYLHGIEQAQHAIDVLQDTDSLERYAREQYYMHAPNEDVYILKDEN